VFPQDKARNADGLRRSLEPVSTEPVAAPAASGMAPLLARLIERQAATGLFSLIQCGASSRLATNDVGKIYFAFYDEPAPKVAMRCNRASV
jgi:hypothetical protein